MSETGSSEVKKQGFFVKLLKVIRKYLLIFVVFVIALIGLAYYATRGVSSTGNAIIANIQDLKCAEVYQMSSDEFKKDITEVDWDAICQSLGTSLTGKPSQTGAEVSASTSGPKVGTVTYNIAAEDEKTYVVTVTLLDEDGWKLHRIAWKQLEETKE